MASTSQKTAERRRLEALARVARAPAATEAALGAKARALVALVGAGDQSPVSGRVLKRELHRVAEREVLTQRGLDGVLAALDALAELERPAHERGELEWPSTTPNRRVRPGSYWPYREGDPQAGSDLEELDLADTHGVRDRWRESLCGPAPWRRGSVADER